MYGSDICHKICCILGYMRNIAIIVSYDGTDFCGWQVQNNGISVAQKINEAILSLTGKKSKLYGSGRTDSGVHAFGQCANFFTEFAAPCERIVLGLNAYLPPEIRVIRAYEVGKDFNARFSAAGKTYEYVIYNANVFSPFYINKAYWVKYNLEVEKMNEAAKVLLGEHDFSAFMAAGSPVKSTVRNLYELNAEKEGSIIKIKASSNGFLYNMVRILTGTLIYAAQGKLSPKDVQNILESGKREKGAPTAPPDGLYLKRVYYKDGYEYVV